MPARFYAFCQYHHAEVFTDYDYVSAPCRSDCWSTAMFSNEAFVNLKLINRKRFQICLMMNSLVPKSSKDILIFFRVRLRKIGFHHVYVFNESLSAISSVKQLGENLFLQVANKCSENDLCENWRTDILIERPIFCSVVRCKWAICIMLDSIIKVPSFCIKPVLFPRLC